MGVPASKLVFAVKDLGYKHESCEALASSLELADNDLRGAACATGGTEVTWFDLLGRIGR